jgi:hypothetical protein
MVGRTPGTVSKRARLVWRAIFILGMSVFSGLTLPGEGELAIPIDVMYVLFLGVIGGTIMEAVVYAGLSGAFPRGRSIPPGGRPK